MNVVIVVSGGVVQDVLVDSPHPEITFRVKVLDYDTDGSDDGVTKSPIDGEHCVIGERAVEISPEVVQKIYDAEPEWIWVRMGDASEYERFVDIEDVGYLLADFDIKPADIRQTEKGIMTSGFEGRNYISLFWGDAKAQPIRELSVEEFAELREAMEPV